MNQARVGGCQFIRDGTAWLSLNNRSDDAKRSAWNLAGVDGSQGNGRSGFWSNHQPRWKSFVGVITRNGLQGSNPIAFSDFHQTCPLPPSTNSSIPVTKLESSDARNNAALAISSGFPIRPMGMVETIRAMASAGCPSMTGVSVGPGLITLERIWRSLRSQVQVRTRERRAAFVAP